jgi:peptidoglycan-associated lipoprotein
MIEAHGKYLRANQAAHVIVQGNTDERGGREYNLALGHKRAESVKRMLSILGVQDQQVETVSFGKEKPRNPGSNETAWAENRRSDLVYQGE